MPNAHDRSGYGGIWRRHEQIGTSALRVDSRRCTQVGVSGPGVGHANRLCQARIRRWLHRSRRLRSARLVAQVIVLSHFQSVPLLAARRANQSAATTSVDLGRTRTDATLNSVGVQLADGPEVDWVVIERVNKDENGCFELDANGCTKLTAYSEATKRAYSLLPT